MSARDPSPPQASQSHRTVCAMHRLSGVPARVTTVYVCLINGTRMAKGNSMQKQERNRAGSVVSRARSRPAARRERRLRLHHQRARVQCVLVHHSERAQEHAQVGVVRVRVVVRLVRMHLRPDLCKKISKIECHQGGKSEVSDALTQPLNHHKWRVLCRSFPSSGS